MSGTKDGPAVLGSQGGVEKEVTYSRTKKKTPVSRGARPDSDEEMSDAEGAEEIMPSRTTKRTRQGVAGPTKTVVKKPPRKPFHKWKPDEYQEYREENPYDEERAYRGNPHF